MLKRCILSAIQVINLELMDKPPETRAANNPWPTWPRIFRIDYGHAEAAAAYGKDPRKYNVMSKRFVLNQGRVVGIEIVQVIPNKESCAVFRDTEKMEAVRVPGS